MTWQFHWMPRRFILMTSQRTSIETLTCKTTVATKNTQLYKTPTNSDAAGRVSSRMSLSVPITISQWNYHHKTHHIYTYSSELILTHIHHCQPTLSTINRIWWWAFSLSLPADEQCHRWNAEIRTSAGAAVLPARANKRTKANKSAFMGWTLSHTRFL